MKQQIMQVLASAFFLFGIVTMANNNADPVTVDCVTHMTIDGAPECVQWEIR